MQDWHASRVSDESVVSAFRRAFPDRASAPGRARTTECARTGVCDRRSDSRYFVATPGRSRGRLGWGTADSLCRPLDVRIRRTFRYDRLQPATRRVRTGHDDPPMVLIPAAARYAPSLKARHAAYNEGEPLSPRSCVNVGAGVRGPPESGGERTGAPLSARDTVRGASEGLFVGQRSGQAVGELSDKSLEVTR